MATNSGNSAIFDTLQRQALSTLETYCSSRRAQLEVSYVIDPPSAASAASGITPATCKVVVRQAGGKVYSTSATANNKKDARAKAAFAIVQHLIAYGEDDAVSSEQPSSTQYSQQQLQTQNVLISSSPTIHTGEADSSSPLQPPAPLFIPAGLFAARDVSTTGTPISSSPRRTHSHPSSQAVSPSGGSANASANTLLKQAESFFASEQPQMRRIESAAISAANMTASSSSSSSSSSSQIPLAQVPAACSASSPNYLACAFTWAVAFTNEIRRIQILSRGDSMMTGLVKLIDRARLRVATPADASTIMGFIRELAHFEKEPEAVKTDEAMLLRDGFSPSRQFHCVILELPESLVREMQTTEGGHSSSSSTTNSTTNNSRSMALDSRTAAQHNEEQKDQESSTMMITSVPTIVRKRPRNSSNEVGGHSDDIGGEEVFLPVAFALSHSTYSTWEGRTLYLEDLYVQPQYRRSGISGLLFQTVCRAALVAKCVRVQWSCLTWNEPAMKAYEGPALQATKLSDWVLYRLKAADISRVSAITPL